MGLFQIQMQMGLWGPKRRADAQIRANELAYTFNTILHNADKDILYRAIAYNLEHRKADLMGRYVGSRFTNYASKGGRIGQRHLSNRASLGITSFNLMLASYGASIKSVGSGLNRAENVIQSLLTGDPRGPAVYPTVNIDKPTKEELEIFEIAGTTLDKLNGLTRLAPAPVPIAEFCLRPENFDLKSICK